MVGFSRMRRAGLLAAAGLAALALASCTDLGGLPKHLKPLSDATEQLIEKKGMEQKAPILVRIFKEESVLEVWKKQKVTGRYALLKTYDICKWSGELGPKKKEGDRQAPEGFYTITPAQMNPNSNYHLAFNLGYPNAFDRAHGRTGSHLMVHGACSSRGCYSMEDEQIQEIYTLARLAFQGGQREFQVQAFPFRMTPENMAKHRHDENFAFWQMLKEGYDNFEVLRQPPKIDVCSKRYVFNSVPQDGVTVSPTGECPPMTTPDVIRVAVEEKAAKDREKFIEIAAKLDAKQERAREDGDASAEPDVMLAAAPTGGEAPAPMSVAAAPVSLEPTAMASAAPAAAAEGAPSPAEPAFLPVSGAETTAVASASAGPDAPATTAALAAPAASATPDERMQAASAPTVANAYVQERERSGVGGFFSRVISKVNPF
jgi:murein L,D-transpeptidase YafK